MNQHNLLLTPHNATKRFNSALLVIVFITFSSFVFGQQSRYPFAFRDVARQVGLLPPLDSINGHGAAWGDIDGNGWLDLYVGTFDKDGSRPNQLFRNKNGNFSRDKQKQVTLTSRTTGVIFADLDNDGDADLYIGSMPQTAGGKNVQAVAGNSMFRNDGKGNFTNVSNGNEACPASFGGRSVTVLDYDGDGLLDILAGEDPLPGYNGSKTKSSRLFRNLGSLRFKDVSREVGLPADVPGYGVAVADVNVDGWPDFFIASNKGGLLLFINDRKGKFIEAPGTREIFAWKDAGSEDMICGVSFGDVNRDGLPDMVLGPHFDRPWISPQPTRLFLNRSTTSSVAFEEVTNAAGLRPIPMKAPHVELQDFDNDGWPDLYASVVKFANGKVYPSIARHMGLINGMPRFEDLSLDVNNFPDAEDLKMNRGRTAPFFNKMIKERKIIYSAAGPSGDYNNDGKLDLFMPNWWPELPSMLLKNETVGGNWLQVRVNGSEGINRMGVGSRINIYRAGKMGNKSDFLGCREIAIGYGYASGQPAIAHFGLGGEELVDIEVIFPHGKGSTSKSNVKAKQQIVLSR